MQLAGVGRVMFWAGGSFWLARIVDGNTRHAHHAIQLSLPLTGEVRFQLDPDGPWQSYAGAVIAPDVPHAFEAPGLVVANILFEPESAAGKAMLERIGPGITALPPEQAAVLAGPIARAHAANAPDADLVALAQQAIAAVSNTSPAVAATDPRVLAAIAHIRGHIDEPVRLAALARLAGISPGRFRHLFAAETGVSCKSFVLWERLNRALELGFGGTSWTEAAHAANFSDSAHLSRTCRRMFGLAPTAGRVERR